MTVKTCCIPSREAGGADHESAVRCLATPALLGVDFVSVPGGRVRVGTDAPVIATDGEGPARKVKIAPFEMSVDAITNAQFASFILDSGYKTDAERFGWSLVFWEFTDQDQSYQRVAQTPWWCRVDGADWAHPFGPKSSWKDVADHPVTHVSWEDANAYAQWAGARLPTEAEWEVAAQGGTYSRYPWGDEAPSDTEVRCNIWQGDFPRQNLALDGYAATAPIRSFAANGYGLHNMVGNVWEWCADDFCVPIVDPRARRQNLQAKQYDGKLLKGGSYLCHESYCFRYRIAARTMATRDSSTGHMGFRIVRSDRSGSASNIDRNRQAACVG